MVSIKLRFNERFQPKHCVRLKCNFIEIANILLNVKSFCYSAYWINAPGLIALIALPGLVGFIVYARYQYCDPLTIGLVDKRDQIVPLYVMEVLAEDLPGFPGIFCAMLFSGALSSISSVLNGLGAVVTSDFAKELLYDRFNVSEKARARFTRLISMFFLYH